MLNKKTTSPFNSEVAAIELAITWLAEAPSNTISPIHYSIQYMYILLHQPHQNWEGRRVLTNVELANQS